MKNIGVSFTIDTLLTVFNRESNKKNKKTKPSSLWKKTFINSFVLWVNTIPT